MKYENPHRRFPKTKIICTMGPSTESPEIVRDLIRHGMSIARLNLSHGTLDSHSKQIELIRHTAGELNTPVGILVDVPGFKYRIGSMNPERIELRPSDEITLTSREIIGDSSIITVSPPGIHGDATIGGPILINDGFIVLNVKAINGLDVKCEVIIGGYVSTLKGVATPGKSPSYDFPGEKTLEALSFANDLRADFIALSTVRNSSDVYTIRNQILADDYNPFIISKIERSDALENFNSILEASDGIMVARGDMGVEVPLSSVPVIQKDLIAKCNDVGKPVITATQMLESMVSSTIPTRAEVTDVANAVFDGTDAIMLSAETSIGMYPIQTVKVMSEIALEAENVLPHESIIKNKAVNLQPKVDDAISYDACRTAYQLKAKLIVAFTESGSTAARVSKYRPHTPILALTPTKITQNVLTINWGVLPVIVDGLESVEDFFNIGQLSALGVNDVSTGDLVVLVAGLPIGIPGGTNLLRVMKLQ